MTRIEILSNGVNIIYVVEGEIKHFTNPLETLHGVVVCAYKERTARNGAQLVPTNCLLTDVHTY